LGMLGAPRARELVRSWTGDGPCDDALRVLAEEARAVVGPGASTSTALDVRYVGQSHELTVPTIGAFHDEHQRRNGYARHDAPIEVVALRARARIDSTIDITGLPVDDRETPEGPAVIAEAECTVFVPDGWRSRQGEAGALVLERR